MASLPGLASLFLARIPAEAQEDTITSFIASCKPRNDEPLNLANIKLSLELLQAHSRNEGLDQILSLVIGEIESADADSETLRETAGLCSEYPILRQQVLRYIEEYLVKTIQLFLVSDLGYHVPTSAFLDAHLSASVSVRGDNVPADDISHGLPTTTRYLDFLKVLFWHTDKVDLNTASTIFTALLVLLGAQSDISNASGDAIAAFIPLLKSNPLPELKFVVTTQIWERICNLLSGASHSEYSSSAFRLWFRWAHQSGEYGPSQDIFQEDEYWSLLQVGLLQGFSEQRKLCLGILQKSIASLDKDVETAHMAFAMTDQRTYETQYTKYCTLFETIVLDRYPNQVAACLGDLSKLMPPTALIHLSWMTTLLSATLSAKVQDGIRKIIGLWYMEFISQSEEGLESQQLFLFQGILPWATQGFLFTPSIISSRDSTECLHGNILCSLIQRFTENCASTNERRNFMRKALEYISTNVSIFQYSIIYILEGLLKGFKSTNALGYMEVEDLSLIVRTSIHAGLPEIAKGLCTTYCMALTAETPDKLCVTVPGYEGLEDRWNQLAFTIPEHRGMLEPGSTATLVMVKNRDSGLQCDGNPDLRSYLNELKEDKYRSLKGIGLVYAIEHLTSVLDNTSSDKISLSLLYEVLEVMWDEIDTQEYPKTSLMKIPHLAFHPICIECCISNYNSASETVHSIEELTRILTRILEAVHQLSEARSYLLPPLAQCLRTACLKHPEIMSVLPVEDFIIRFANHPPSPRSDFLFEAAAALKLECYVPHRTCASYYGERESFGYACVMDLVNRLSNLDIGIAQNLLDRIIEPWTTQKSPVPIVSKWKTHTQLYIMLLLSEGCISKGDASIDRYLVAFMAVLAIEPLPRYRYVLEWMLSRLYFHSPVDRSLLLDTLATQEEANPKLTASLMKMAVIVACFPDTPADFSLRLMTLLVPLCASGKIQIRHEAHWTFPSVWDHVEQRGWTGMGMLENPAFEALNAHIRGLWRFQTPTSAYNSRSLKLDLVTDHTLANLFQGDYLRTHPVERELVMTGDFEKLWALDAAANYDFSNAEPLIPLGSPRPPIEIPPAPQTPPSSQTDVTTKGEPTDSAPAPLQTKSDAWQYALAPTSPTTRNSTPLILIASLITNPTNLGGLSRCAEIFGCSALAVPALAPLSTPAFTSVAVTSHNHIPIFALPPTELVQYLVDKKKEGYSVVCVEQTDRSKVLGEAGTVVPRKTVLVLGSEKGGVPGEVLKEADGCVEIRQMGITRSLNVQTAAGVVLFEYQRLWA